MYNIEFSSNIGTSDQEATKALHPVGSVINSQPTSPPTPGLISWKTPNIEFSINLGSPLIGILALKLYPLDPPATDVSKVKTPFDPITH